MKSLYSGLIVLPLLAATGCKKTPPPETQHAPPFSAGQPFPNAPGIDLSRVPGTPGKPWPTPTKPPEDLNSPRVKAYPSFSPDSKLLAMFGGREAAPELQIRDTRGKILAKAKASIDTLGPISWKADSQRVILNGQSAQIFKITRQGEAISLTEVVAYKVPASHVFRNGYPLPYTTSEPVTKTPIYRTTGTEISAVHQMGALSQATFTRPQRYRVELFNLKTPTRPIPLTTMTWGAHGTSFSPAGSARLLVWETQDGRQWSYAAWDLKTRKRLWQRDFVGLEVHAKWSQDGRNVLISRIEKSVPPVRLYPIFPPHAPMEWLDARTGKTLRKITTQRTQHITDIVGDRIYNFGTDSDRKLNPHSMRIINPQNGQTQAMLYPSRFFGTELNNTIAFSPNGQQMVFAETYEPVLSWRISDLKAQRNQPESWYDELEDEDY